MFADDRNNVSFKLPNKLIVTEESVEKSISSAKKKGKDHSDDKKRKSFRKGAHIKKLIDLPPFPLDLIGMKNRNRKLLASLNIKKRLKDFEYKNYDSTDSDLYEEEDFLAI